MSRWWNRFTDISRRADSDRKSGFFQMVCLLLLGFLVGAAASGTVSTLDDGRFLRLSAAIDSLYDAPQFGRLFVRSITVDAVYYLLCVAGGLFALGMAVVWFVAVLRGLSCGIIAGTLCISHGIGGFAFYVIAVLPGLFVSLLAFSYAAAGCCEFAWQHFNSTFGIGKQGIAPVPKPLKGVVLCVVCSLIAGVVGSALSALFYRLLS